LHEVGCYSDSRDYSRKVSRRLFALGRAVGFVMLAASVFMPLRATAADSDPAIEALLKPIRQQYGVPALGGAIVTPDGMAVCGAIGVRKNGSDKPVTANDHWHLGSDTKAMTAEMLGRLVEKGVLSWNTTVGETIGPKLGIQLGDAANITLIELLHHRSGLPANLRWREIPTVLPLPEQRLLAARQALSQPLQSQPDSKFLYSNLGYTMAATMAEVASGHSWEELMQENLFAPLKMKVGEGAQCEDHGPLEEPWGHNPDGSPECGDNPLVMAPAGCINASMENWSKFIADALRGGMGLPALLQPQTYQVLQTPAPRGANPYAGGWGVTRRPWAKGRCFNHVGSNTLNVADAWVAPNVGFAVIAVTNQGGPAANKACDAACAALIGYYNQHPPQPQTAAPPQ
jgi:CubicO group peptidase (beta-lactamase class C family)